MTVRRAPRRAPARGITLVELAVGFAVLGILVASVAPYLGEFIVNSRLRESGTTLFTETLIAQSEAVKRNTTVRVSTSGATIQVLDMTTPGSPVVLRTQLLGGNVVAPVASFDLGPEGRPEPFGTSASINLALSIGSCSASQRCPGLRVDAGGAVRLCPDQQVSCP